MSADKNNNGIDDAGEVTFHGRSFLAGCVVGLFGGGVTLSILVFFFPALGGLLAVFAGNVCKPIEAELSRCNEAISCVEGGDNLSETCAAKLENEDGS